MTPPNDSYMHRRTAQCYKRIFQRMKTNLLRYKAFDIIRVLWGELRYRTRLSREDTPPADGRGGDTA